MSNKFFKQFIISVKDGFKKDINILYEIFFIILYGSFWCFLAIFWLGLNGSNLFIFCGFVLVSYQIGKINKQLYEATKEIEELNYKIVELKCNLKNLYDKIDQEL